MIKALILISVPLSIVGAIIVTLIVFRKRKRRKNKDEVVEHLIEVIKSQAQKNMVLCREVKYKLDKGTATNEDIKGILVEMNELEFYKRELLKRIEAMNLEESLKKRK